MYSKKPLFNMYEYPEDLFPSAGEALREGLNLVHDCVKSCNSQSGANLVFEKEENLFFKGERGVVIFYCQG